MQYRGADQGYEVLKRLSEVLTDKPNSSSSKQKELIQELTRFSLTTVSWMSFLLLKSKMLSCSSNRIGQIFNYLSH